MNIRITFNLMVSDQQRSYTGTHKIRGETSPSQERDTNVHPELSGLPFANVNFHYYNFSK